MASHARHYVLLPPFVLQDPKTAAMKTTPFKSPLKNSPTKSRIPIVGTLNMDALESTHGEDSCPAVKDAPPALPQSVSAPLRLDIPIMSGEALFSSSDGNVASAVEGQQVEVVKVASEVKTEQPVGRTQRAAMKVSTLLIDEPTVLLKAPTPKDSKPPLPPPSPAPLSGSPGTRQNKFFPPNGTKTTNSFAQHGSPPTQQQTSRPPFPGSPGTRQRKSWPIQPLELEKSSRAATPSASPVGTSPEPTPKTSSPQHSMEQVQR
jgi:hypothetical protein